MLFRTRFSTTFSAIFSTILENIKKNIVLVTSLSETSTFYHILICFHSGRGVQYFKQILISQKFTNTLIFLHKKLYHTPLFRENNRCSPSQTFFKSFTFYHIFTTFNSQRSLQYFK